MKISNSAVFKPCNRLNPFAFDTNICRLDLKKELFFPANRYTNL